MIDLSIDPEEIFDDRDPVTPFEEQIKLAIEKRSQDRHFLNILLQTQLYICKSNNTKRKLDLMPYFVCKTPYGEMVALFSSKYRMCLYEKYFNDYEFAWGRELIARFPKKFGIILNPKSYLSFQLGPKQLEEIKDSIL